MEPPNDPELDALLTKFAAKGEVRVRQDIAMKRYNSRRIKAAEYYIWLTENDHQTKMNTASLRTATSAKNAAWMAALAAIIAAVFAIMAYFFPR